jgi:hypothetical protein
MPEFVHPTIGLFFCLLVYPVCLSVFLSIHPYSLHRSVLHLLMSVVVMADEIAQGKQIHLPLDQGKENLVARAEIFNCGRAGSNVTSEQIVEDLGNILLGLKLEPANVVDQQLK